MNSYNLMKNLQNSGNLTVIDKVPQDMLHLIDPHWYQFPPLNPLWHSILGFALGVFGTISILGNLCVIYIFSKTKGLRTPSNLFVVNLAMSDFMMMFTMVPPMVMNSYYETWIFGPFACQIYAMLGSIFGNASIWTMTAIAYDRYNVIVKGIAGKPLTNGKAIFFNLLIWITSIAWTILPLFGWGRYSPEGNMAVCGTDYLSKDWNTRSYVIIYGLWCYFLPLYLICFSYYFILSAVSKHEKQMKEQAKKMNVASLRAENSAKNMECKLAKVALVTISLWFLAWTPYMIINYGAIFELVKISPLTSIWSSIFAKANAMYNPIVYGISHPKYRQALEKTFPSLVCASGSDLADENQSNATEASKVTETSVSA